MKRLVSILLTAIMIMSVGVTGLAIDASAAETAIVNGKACEVGTNVTYTVDLCIDTVFEDFQGEVIYDSDALQVVSAKLPNTKAGMMYNTDIPGYIYYSGSNFMAPYDFKEEKVFLTAEFKVLKAGTYTVTNKFEVMTGQDENGDSISPPFVLDGIINKDFTTKEEVVADSPVVTTTTSTTTTSSTTATTATTPIVSDTTFNGKNVNVGDKVSVSCYVKTDQKCEDFDVRFYYGATKGNLSGIELVSFNPVETAGTMNNTSLSGEIRYNGTNYADPYDFTSGKTLATATFLIKEGNADYFANSVMYILTGADGTYYATNGVMETPFTWNEATDVVPATTTSTTTSTTKATTTSTTKATTTSTTKPSTTSSSTTVPASSDTTFNGKKVSVGDKVTVTYYVQTDKKCEDFDAHMTYGTKTINPNGIELVSFTPYQTKGVIYNTDIYGEIYYNGTSFNDPYDFTTKSALMSATFLIKEAGGQYFADGVMYYLTGVDGTDYATKGQMNTPFTWEVQNSPVPTTTSTTKATTTSTTTVPTGRTTFNGKDVNVGDKVTVTYYVQTDKKCEDFDAHMTYGTKTINPNGIELVSFTPYQTKGVIYNTDIYGEIYYNGTSFNDPYDFTTKSALMSATFLIKEAGGQYFADGVMYYLTGVDGTDYATKGQMNTPFTWEVQYSSVPATSSSSSTTTASSTQKSTTTSTTTATTTSSTTATTTSTTTAPVKEYQVVNNLVNVRSSSTATTAEEGSTFTTILVPDTGYKISTVVANNGSQTITPVYNNDGTVTLSAVVTGDIVVTAIALPIQTTTSSTTATSTTSATTTSTTTATTTSSTTATTTSSTTATTTSSTSTTQPSSTKETIPETKPGDVIEVKKISLNKTAIRVKEGQSFNIVASIWPGYTTEKTVTWSVNNSRVGVCSQSLEKYTKYNLYDNEGKIYCTETARFTAKRSGQTIIKTVTNTGRVAKCVVYVDPVATTLKVSKTSVTLNVGKSTTVKATVGPASIKPAYKKVAWTTSNKKVATVTSAGKIVARGKGVCTVYATSTDKTTLKRAIRVTVKQPVTSVKFNKSSMTLAKKGSSTTVKAYAYPTNANNKTLAIKSENKKIAKVSKSAVNSGTTIKVTAVKKGSTYVRATARDGSKKYARIRVIVKK